MIYMVKRKNSFDIFSSSTKFVEETKCYAAKLSLKELKPNRLC